MDDGSHLVHPLAHEPYLPFFSTVVVRHELVDIRVSRLGFGFLAEEGKGEGRGSMVDDLRRRRGSTVVVDQVVVAVCPRTSEVVRAWLSKWCLTFD